jgi:hypothetical protein
MSTIQISSGAKLDRTSAPIALAALLAVGMAAVVTAAPAVAQEKMSPAEKKPNILFIMGDDIGWMQPSIYHEAWRSVKRPTSTASATKAQSS